MEKVEEIKREIKRLEIMMNGYKNDKNYEAVQAIEFKLMDLEAEIYNF